MISSVLRPAVFLDRDGVINVAVVKNGKPYPPGSVAELVFTPGVEQIFTHLKTAGYLLIGITNQPDVARGIQKREIVEEINALIMENFPVQEILVCYHDERDQCLCRKPKPGLIFQAAQRYAIDLTKSFMVGDRRKDIETGKSAGCKTIFLNQHYDEPFPDPPADYMVTRLEDILTVIIST